MIAYVENQPSHPSTTPATVISDYDSITMREAFGCDFGGTIRTLPVTVVHPSTADEVASAVRFASENGLVIAARGNGHSVNGQAGAAGGVVLDMRALAGPIRLVNGPNGVCADVSAGMLWEEVLEWAVAQHRRTLPSWTDYLGLTVGGTLSNAGISGQAFRHGPQVANVVELEVVSGDGVRRVCSPEFGADLFFAVLGGLGQFGVITRVKIPLLPAPDMVNWIRVVYIDFARYASDAETLVRLVGPGSLDYVEGFAFVNSDDPFNGYGLVPFDQVRCPFDQDRIPPGAGPILYCLELALHFDHGEHNIIEQRTAKILRSLGYVKGLEFYAHVSYVEFLSRVKRLESEARANGSWYTPHPWLNLFVSAADIVDFDREVFGKILYRGIGGPMLVYPMLRSKWDERMSVVVPRGEVFYLVALLRFALPPPAGPSLEEMAKENREVVDRCRSAGFDFKLYMPNYQTKEEWSDHFGETGWCRFVDRKARFDPFAMFSPGQRIFPRQQKEAAPAAAGDDAD
ncbi:hypothetical protein HPP92_018765 [Vanilla planifolia]|uniref:cytokinin dehydrogenase n=1 Tax=Vanilla planifolia TaxID=51239 RepID=A0A835Q1P4_VANPL|nr:hypothetical protein HPP92_018765 [Vanilla planifolia]